MTSIMGKRILLTGGSRGLGPVIAEALAERGAHLALPSGRDKAAAYHRRSLYVAPAMPVIDYSRLYRYDDLMALLRAFEAEQPQYVALSTIGTSHEGRAIPLLTITNTATGRAEDKPDYWVDGNIHSVELSASSACLYFVDWLMKGKDTYAEIRRALDTRTLYVCPRINPDGAEWAMADRPKYVRPSTRRYPYDEEPLEGLIAEDINGDGRILQMRIADPNGPWKRHPAEPRLLVRRDPLDPPGRGRNALLLYLVCLSRDRGDHIFLPVVRQGRERWKI